MKKMFSSGYKFMSIDTETFEVKQIGVSISPRIDYMYCVDEDGEFIHGAQVLPVKAGDIVMVLYRISDNERKIVVLSDEIYRAEINAYVKYEKERSALKQGGPKESVDMCAIKPAC